MENLFHGEAGGSHWWSPDRTGDDEYRQATPIGRWVARLLSRERTPATPVRALWTAMMHFIAARYQRAGLLGMAVCFVTVSISVANYDGREPWTLVLMSSLFGTAAVLMAAFAIRPDVGWLYRYSGAFVVVAAMSRLLILPVWRSQLGGGYEDEWWVFAATAGLMIPFVVLFWWFWRREVWPWHHKHHERIK